MWKFYQNKSLDAVTVPAHVLFLPIDNFKIINFLNFNDVGSNPLNESVAFKKTKTVCKHFTANLVGNSCNLTNKYKQLSFFFKNDNAYTDSLYFGIKRQHNFLTNSALTNNQSTFFDFKSSTA